MRKSIIFCCIYKYVRLPLVKVNKIKIIIKKNIYTYKNERLSFVESKTSGPFAIKVIPIDFWTLGGCS